MPKGKELSKNQKEQNIKEIAEAMVSNMKVNMDDPEFWNRNDKIKEEFRKKVLEERRKRHNEEKEEI